MNVYNIRLLIKYVSMWTFAHWLCSGGWLEWLYSFAGIWSLKGNSCESFLLKITNVNLTVVLYKKGDNQSQSDHPLATTNICKTEKRLFEWQYFRFETGENDGYNTHCWTTWTLISINNSIHAESTFKLPWIRSVFPSKDIFPQVIKWCWRRWLCCECSKSILSGLFTKR